MGYHYYLMTTNVIVMVATAVIGLKKYRKADSGFKIFTLFICSSFLVECIAYYAAIVYHDNLKVYAINSIIEIIWLSLYFNQTITLFGKFKIGYYIAFFSFIFGLINLFWGIESNALDTLFTLYIAFIIIIMGMISITQNIFITKEVQHNRKHHTQISMVLICYWTISFLIWALYDVFTTRFPKEKWMIDMSLFSLNIIVNICFWMIFILYPKNKDAR